MPKYVVSVALQGYVQQERLSLDKEKHLSLSDTVSNFKTRNWVRRPVLNRRHGGDVFQKCEKVSRLD